MTMTGAETENEESGAEWLRRASGHAPITEADPPAEPPAPPAGHVRGGPRGDLADGYYGSDWMREKLNGRSLLQP